MSLVPVVCFSCGAMFEPRYREFQARLAELQPKEESEWGVVGRSREGRDPREATAIIQVLQEMGIKRDCCRRMYMCTDETIYKLWSPVGTGVKKDE